MKIMTRNEAKRRKEERNKGKNQCKEIWKVRRRMSLIDVLSLSTSITSLQFPKNEMSSNTFKKIWTR